MATIANPTVPMMHRKPISSYAPMPNYSQPHSAATSQYQVNNGSRNTSSAYTGPPSPYSMPAQSRRTLSNATSSSASSNTHNMTRVPTGGYGSSIHRSTSARSNQSASPTSYVALMRKQKATVWCDRAQHQDPRILAAQRQAKMRAVMEVAGGHNHNPQARASTGSSGMGGVRSKIRHHGAPKAKDYGAGNMSGAGVPMRLSATEVDEDESDEDQKAYHRASSSRSSMGSSKAFGHDSYRGYGNDSSPPNAVSPGESLSDLAEEQTPMPGRLAGQSDYFGGSNADNEMEKSFGGVTGLPVRQRSDSEHMSTDELRRRGSVDERTMTMSAGRLFVANPDLSD